MKRNKILLAILFFTILPNLTYADCTQEEINNFKKIENKYKITYQYSKNTQDYNVTFYSPEPEKYDYVAYIGEDINCEETDENTTACSNIPIGNYFIQIKGTSNNCTDVLKSINLSLENYNIYADDPLCEGYEEFVLCNPLYDKEIDYDTFVSRLNTYKKTKQRENTNEDNSQKTSQIIINDLTDFIKDNIFKIIIVVILIIVISTAIALIAKSIRKSRRLE